MPSLYIWIYAYMWIKDTRKENENEIDGSIKDITKESKYKFHIPLQWHRVAWTCAVKGSKLKTYKRVSTMTAPFELYQSWVE